MYHLTTLRNGIPLVTIPLDGAKSVTILILVKVGSRYEDRRTNGLSHFVEHLMFKGTTKRPQTKMIAETLDGYGAEYNAFTNKDHTGYYIKLRSDRAHEAADILRDMLFHSLFKSEELERERLVIFEEIKMYDENPLMELEDIFEETMYGDTPLGWKIAGNKQRVGSVKRQDVMNFVRTHYTPRNLAVICSGDVRDELRATIAELFGGEGLRMKPSVNKFPAYRHNQRAPKIFAKEKKLEQVQLGLGFEGGFSYTAKDRYAAGVLATILGGSMSSRLFTEVRERRGLCYFIRASIASYHDAGNFFIHSGLDAARVEPALKVIVQELKKTAQTGVSPAELKRAQDYLIGKKTLSLEDSENVAQTYANGLVLAGKITEPEEQFKHIAAVTATQVQAVAKKIFKPAKATLAIIGPKIDIQKYKKILLNF